ncbi:MAG: hypothetical protein GVY13_13320 [Alphaproteobacteria bacterium]|nr:hypothetical protein [Alphaproteobacteria bacterium]
MTHNLRNTVQDIARSFVTASACEDGSVRLVTQCFYPSKEAVCLRITGGVDTFVVSDEGGALDDAETAGLPTAPVVKTIARMARRSGLDAESGVILSPLVQVADLPAAILLVANASKEVAHASLERWKPTETRRSWTTKGLGKQNF